MLVNLSKKRFMKPKNIKSNVYSFSVPVERILLALRLLKRLVPEMGSYRVQGISFEPSGLYAFHDSFGIFVAQPLDVPRSLEFQVADLQLLSDAEGTATFSSSASLERADGSACQRFYVKCMKRGVKQQEVMAASHAEAKAEFIKPKKCYDGQSFLSRLAKGAPFIDEVLYPFVECHETGITVTSGRVLFHNEEENAVPVFDQPFILSCELLKLLPTKASKNTATIGLTKIETADERSIRALYLAFNKGRYTLLVTSVDRRFPRWRRLLEQPDKAYKLTLDPQDVKVLIAWLRVVDKNSNSRRSASVRLHIVDGRVCVDTYHSDRDNLRIRLSAASTGALATEDTVLDAVNLRRVLALDVTVLTQGEAIVTRRDQEEIVSYRPIVCNVGTTTLLIQQQNIDSMPIDFKLARKITTITDVEKQLLLPVKKAKKKETKA